MRQFALRMALPVSYAPGDLASTPANEALLAHLRADPSLLGMGALLSGPLGSGKTHYARAWAEWHGARWLLPEQLGQAPAEELLESTSRIVLDDVEQIAHWPALVPLLNLLAARGGQALITLSAPLESIPLADARSRLAGLTPLPIPEPDEALVEYHLRKRWSDWQWQVDQDVLAYLLPRMERSYAGITQVCDALAQAVETAHRRLTIPLIRTVLEEIHA